MSCVVEKKQRRIYIYIYINDALFTSGRVRDLYACAFGICHWKRLKSNLNEILTDLTSHRIICVSTVYILYVRVSFVLECFYCVFLYDKCYIRTHPRKAWFCGANTVLYVHICIRVLCANTYDVREETCIRYRDGTRRMQVLSIACHDK